jgi:hypothetical protein
VRAFNDAASDGIGPPEYVIKCPNCGGSTTIDDHGSFRTFRCDARPPCDYSFDQDLPRYIEDRFRAQED